MKCALPAALSAFLIFVPAVQLWGQGDAPQTKYYYLYLSDQRIATVELSGPQQVILNYINLSDSIEVIQSPLLVVVDSEGNHYNSHLFESESQDPNEKYFVSELLKPREFRGYTLVGNFRFKAPPEKVYLQVGARILQPELLQPKEFEVAAARIGQIDLASPSFRAAIMRVGFRRGFGEIFFRGSESAQPIEGLFPDLKLVPPIPVEALPPLLPPSAQSLPDPVVVRVSVSISRSGGIFNPEVVEGINPELDRLAVDSVRNSWRFLPAISEGKVADAQVTLNVVFQRQRTR